jgi:hypothetical protein
MQEYPVLLYHKVMNGLCISINRTVIDIIDIIIRGERGMLGGALYTGDFDR